MKFLAVSPGVHTIAALTLMDVELGYSINLRWVWFFLLGLYRQLFFFFCVEVDL